MADGSYNCVYRSLVRSGDDVVGMLAYSIYKQHKIEFIEQFKQDKHCLPSQSDIENFVRSSMTKGQLEKYRGWAASILTVTVADALEVELNKSTLDFQQAVEPVVKRHTYSVGKTILLNVAASFLFSVLLVIVFLLGYTTESGLRNKTKAVVETLREATSEQVADSLRIR